MKYYIWAAESVYCGLYDMYESSVEECNSFDEAIQLGREMAYDVINSYDCTLPDPEDFMNSDWDELDWYEDHELVYVWEIKPEYQSTSIDDLNLARVNLSHTDFVTQYCKVFYGADLNHSAIDNF